jgi:hypothetical protein
MLIYIVEFQPFEKQLINYLEIFNELCILAVAYHLLLFTDFVSDLDIQYNAGWSIVLLTALNIVVNMIVIFIELIKLLIPVISRIK